MPVLDLTEQVVQLAGTYQRELGLPDAARADVLHIAFSCAYGVDYLLTLNCRHIANAIVMRRLFLFNQRIGQHSPVILTPLELLGPDLEVPDA